MEEQNAPIFSQAKLEYTNQLIDTLTPHFFDGIKSIYDEAKTVNNVNKNQSITLLFRNFLEKVPSWSNVIVETETDRIIKMTDCDWMDDLITAVFISHTKILTSIGANPTNANIDLVIPKTTNFIHKCYINIAREMWKNPYLFNEYIVASEYQKNMRTVEIIIKESMENTIRQLLPIKEILKQHLDTYESNQAEVQKRVDANNIRQMLLEEIKNLNLVNPKVEKEETKEEEEDKMVVEENEEDQMEVDAGDKIILNEQDNVVDDEDNIEDDYVSVDEETIKKNCENLEINTINEETYDNADIIDEKNKETDGKDKTILEKFIQTLVPDEDDDGDSINEDLNNEKEVVDTIEDILTPRKEEKEEKKVEVEEKEEEKKEEKKEEKNEEVEEKKEEKKEEKEEEKEEKKEEKKEEVEEKEEKKEVEEKEEKKVEEKEEKKVEEKEVISVEKISDTETVDEFFNDISQLMEKKGALTINKKPDKYTLFDDAENSE